MTRVHGTQGTSWGVLMHKAVDVQEVRYDAGAWHPRHCVGCANAQERRCTGTTALLPLGLERFSFTLFFTP
ncbi:hypothetical protein EZV61_07970 [Corallincola luteus]|uniref:Uncharacterized protein n=2 Tax=Corallincola luteus TaxID=1775177 RepID=A0ABY2AQQ2_9GAMM|nr:hypothetical protein EZV61_07970 [Corallincola luteus]